ncbi:MAG: phage tail protein I [Chloroflexota bacterium]
MTEQFEFQLHVSGPEIEKAFRLPPGKIMIGRQEGNSLPLPHFLVSRQHAQLDCAASGCQITDLGSANGTLLNGEKLAAHIPMPLADRAVIQIGPFTLTFRQIPAAVKDAVPPPTTTATETAVSPGITTEEKAAPPKAQQEKPAPQAAPEPEAERPFPTDLAPPPGLSRHSTRFIDYLPGIYQTDFMSRFMALFESIIIPLEWNADNFDMFLDPQTAPSAFLPWLMNWFNLAFDDTWSETQRRTMLAEAHAIHARHGTKWALRRVLEIYTGHTPEIDDESEGQDPFIFTVSLPAACKENAALIEQLINAYKPAHTSYRLVYS